MPFESLAQEGFAHANPEKFGGKAVVEEFDKATKGLKLPKRKAPKAKKNTAPAVRMRHTATPR
jgi:hypothetical protein